MSCSTANNTQASKITINRWLWLRLLRELRKRGEGQRESGAFLLAPKNSRKVTRFVCFDDLDPYCLDSGIIRFDGAAFVPLWQMCTNEKLQVVADIHTHPSAWTGMSSLDKEHPMVCQKGHVGLIAPDYAQNIWQDLRGIGVYEYLGDGRWKAWSPKENKIDLSYF